MAESDGFLRRFWAAVETYGTLQTLGQMAAASGVAAWGLSVMPGGWHPPQYWVSAGALFFGTWMLFAVAVRIWKVGVPRWQQWRHPSRLEIACNGGDNGVVTVTLRGQPATVSADGRIVRLLAGEVNPSPHLFECLLRRGADNWTSVVLSDGDWVHIVMSSRMSVEDWRGGRTHGFYIHRGKTSVGVPQSGAAVEITLKVRHALGHSQETRTFTVHWEGAHSVVAAV